jgi:peptidoglycan/LPS O-acetylase OafA/YrhL
MLQQPKRSNFPHKNNLEWLRLFFALQVFLEHSASHLAFQIPSLIDAFPGVPVFFFVSGFLVYASYLNEPGKPYFTNRFLRLYPGLVFVTIGGVCVALITLGVDGFLKNYQTFFLWFLAQTTIGQAWNPEIFRGVGVGVINGSLWTITVEILFYLAVPLIVWSEKKIKFFVFYISIISFGIYAAGPLFFTKIIYRDKSFYDFLALTPIVWGWMFGIGIISFKYWDNLRLGLKYFPLFLVPIFITIEFGTGILFGSPQNRIGLVYFICYALLVLWAAFFIPYKKLSIDLSYGIYIWHMVVINFLLIFHIPNFILATVLTIFFAGFSWFCLERPALKFKKKSLRRI